ncbi:hypothetical protein [Wolbachia endosymbiont of Chironomus riparius]|uniref:hypothetical protein n=1 Tax=Wolbachia endosymbiont of Chironomus riparius TaxID=2883238 RepID=UPI00209DA99B|nr:hypothetical protein [Wolbachia endosymbiont of Chironomus riparius]
MSNNIKYYLSELLSNFKLCGFLYKQGVRYLYTQVTDNDLVSQLVKQKLKNIVDHTMNGEIYNKDSREYKFTAELINKLILHGKTFTIENSDNDSCYSFDKEWVDFCATDISNNTLPEKQGGLTNSSNENGFKRTLLRIVGEVSKISRKKAKKEQSIRNEWQSKLDVKFEENRDTDTIENSDNDSCYSFDKEWVDFCATDILNNTSYKKQDGLSHLNNSSGFLKLELLKQHLGELRKTQDEFSPQIKVKAKWMELAQDRWQTELDVKFEENRDTELSKIAKDINSKFMKKSVNNVNNGYFCISLGGIQDRISTNNLGGEYTYKQMYQDRKILLKNEIYEVETFLRNKDITKTDKCVLKKMHTELKKECKRSLTTFDPQNDHMIQEWQKTRSTPPHSSLQKISTYELNQRENTMI